MDLIQGNIRFEPETHRYTFIGNGRPKRLTAVSTVINTVYNKKSWDGVDVAVVENARDRGVALDRYVEEYVHRGSVAIPAYERTDVIERFEIVAPVIDSLIQKSAKTQVIVSSLADGIAGTCDMIIDDSLLVDLKCTYNPEHAWKLQMGAYLDYSGCTRAAVIHVSPKLYPLTGGYALIWYDVAECKLLWRHAVNWLERTKYMEQNDEAYILSKETIL